MLIRRPLWVALGAFMVFAFFVLFPTAHSFHHHTVTPSYFASTGPSIPDLKYDINNKTLGVSSRLRMIETTPMMY